MIANIKNLLHLLHKYFVRSSKYHIEFIKLVDMMCSKGLKINKNVKTRWLSMISPLKRVMSKYRTFVHKLHKDKNDATTTHALARLPSSIMNCSLLFLYKLPLNVFLPLLETIHYLIKFS